MKIVSSSAVLSVIVGLAALGMSGYSGGAHAEAQILPPPSVCVLLYQNCIKGGGTRAECAPLLVGCSP